MKLAVPIDEQNLDSVVSPFFARATFYAIFEDDKEPEIIANPASAMPSGAGIQAAQFIIQNGIDTVASLNYGPNSSMILSQAGVKMLIAQPNMTAREIYEKAKAGELQEWNGIPYQPPFWSAFLRNSPADNNYRQSNTTNGRCKYELRIQSLLWLSLRRIPLWVSLWLWIWIRLVGSRLGLGQRSWIW